MSVLHSIIIGRKFKKKMIKPLAGMLRQDYPLPEIFEHLSGAFRTRKYAFRKVASGLKEGESLSDALKKSKLKIPPLVKSLIKTGEEKDALHGAVSVASDIQDGGPAKPAIHPWDYYIYVICVLGILFVRLVFTVPTFEKVYSDMQVGSLPAFSRYVIGLSDWLVYGGWLWVLIFIVVAIPLIIIASKRGHIHWLGMQIPGIKRLALYSGWWPVLYGTGRLMQEGLRFEDALKAMVSAGKMRMLSKKADKVKHYIHEGLDPRAACEKSGLFMEPLQLALLSGEAKGDIAGTLVSYGESCRRLQVSLIEKWYPVFGTIAILIVIILVLITIVSMYLPIFGLVGGMAL